MPDIVSSKDPEGTLLKCAEANNLSPAQLEKLGQTFNTAKTIVGLEKQANRGDSFKIVDVPSLISKYATYSPDKVLSNKSKKVHEKVDRLFDDQDGWSACISVSKSASATSSLPDLSKMVFDQLSSGVVDSTDEEVYEIDSPHAGATWKWHNKIASAEARIHESVEGDLRIAEETLEQLCFEIPMDITEKCAAIKFALTPDDGRWSEAAEDIRDVLGSEKSAAVISAVEQYFKNVNHVVETPEPVKRACKRNIAQDRHGVVEIAKEIAALQELQEKVAATTTDSKKEKKEKKNRDKKPSPQTPPVPKGSPTAPGRSADYVDVDSVDPVDIPVVDGGEDTGLGSSSYLDITPPEDYTMKPVSDLTALLDEMGPNLKHIVPDQEIVFNTKPITTLETVLSKVGPSSNTRAKLIDKAVRQAQMDTTLQQLMLSDDVISDADPKEVQDIFKTLASISPSLATDPGKMGPALKEALQYGSVPINILSDASKLEGQILKNEADRANVERIKYGL